MAGGHQAALDAEPAVRSGLGAWVWGILGTVF